MGLWVALGTMRHHIALALTVPLLASCQVKSIEVLGGITTPLEISGMVCTDPPRLSDFPLKVLFVVDGSGSFQFVDPDKFRVTAVRETIDAFQDKPNVSFGILRFNESVDVLTKPGLDIHADDPFSADFSGVFTRDATILDPALQALEVADSVTDYHSALSVAREVLRADMEATDPKVLKRTKYVVAFLSDGEPFPRCCSTASENDGLCVRSENISFCEDPQAVRTNPNQLPFLSEAEDFNLPYQLLDLAKEIADLSVTFEVGGLSFDTSFLFDTSDLNGPNEDGCYFLGPTIFVCPSSVRDLLGNMARLGKGNYFEFNTAEEISFEPFGLEALRREQALKKLIVTNLSAPVQERALLVDSDADGLTDAFESARALNLASRDTDGDGYSDRVEQSVGTSPTESDHGCSVIADRADPDGDGLLVCEEVALGTSSNRFDTDGDGLPDRLELIAGTNPTRPDDEEDLDEDGFTNGEEIWSHTSVTTDEGDLREELAYQYRIAEAGMNDAGGRCYDFTVSNIRLVAPAAEARDVANAGKNDIQLYFIETPADERTLPGHLKRACVDTRAQEDGSIRPADGLATLDPADFFEPSENGFERCTVNHP